MTTTDLPTTIGAPARRALDGAGVTTLRQLSRLTAEEVLALHGVGPKAVRLLEEALDSAGLAFKETGVVARPKSSTSRRS